MPEIDDAIFKQLVADIGRDGLQDFSVLFVEDVKQTGDDMLAAAVKGDWEKVQMQAHAVKGSVLSFGLIALSELALEIEEQCKATGRANPESLRNWSPHLAIALTALEKRLAGMGFRISV
jgi:HPt (histidine-containing phosphotransfer) domain-containing protein